MSRYRANDPGTPRWRLTANAVVAAVLFFALAFGVASAPACAASQRQNAIKTALVTVDTARDAFVAYDAAMQTQIVSTALSIEDGKAKLAAYRSNRDKVAMLFDTAYHAIAAAAVANDDPSVAGMQAALAQLAAAVAPYLGAKQ